MPGGDKDGGGIRQGEEELEGVCAAGQVSI